MSKASNYTAGEATGPCLDLEVPESLAGMRLDQGLARLLPDESRSRLALLIESGDVTVDGERAAPKRRLRGGERLRVTLRPRPQDRPQRGQALEIAVVHEDGEVLVINKPAGLVVHPGSGNWEGTLLNGLLHRVPQLSALPRAGIVHRLDKDTSGLMVVAKTEAAMQCLVRALAAHRVARTYLALAKGKVSAPGTVSAPIGRHRSQRTKMAVVPGGKPAVTHYLVAERFPAHTLLQCDLETGRTHQIRVHLASIGHPIEGDPAYGPRSARLLGRQALHAWRLAFRHPGTGEEVRFEAALPADMAHVLDGLRRH